jgi:membrane protein required for colicin V production
MADWNTVDWLLVLILLVSMVLGWWRGVVRTLLGLVGLAGGFLLARGNYMQLGVWLHDKHLIRSDLAARAASFILLFSLVVAGAQLTGRLLHTTIRKSGLGFVNHALGAGFGLVRGCVIAIALLIIPTAFVPQLKAVSTSVLTPYFLGVAHDVSFVLPRSLRFG